MVQQTKMKMICIASWMWHCNVLQQESCY